MPLPHSFVRPFLPLPRSGEQLFGLVQFTVKWFFIAVIVYSLFDLAANSKLVAAPNVHMAETSDKTFDDVVGVDEVCQI